ncbi:toll/interleukin-1 receptor domain-containing protein [Bradyrhizobium sp.]|uniref:toll/interleukin-1 receptor domain-containing protein n=1 Tax=Bradyrhizobium sp. TaxID=376 RepID=UPI003FA5815D
MSSRRQGVFVSYSHRDNSWLDRLRTLLKPALGSETIWDDKMIAPGANWSVEIERAIRGSPRCGVACDTSVSELRFHRVRRTRTDHPAREEKV